MMQDVRERMHVVNRPTRHPCDGIQYALATVTSSGHFCTNSDFSFGRGGVSCLLYTIYYIEHYIEQYQSNVDGGTQ